MRTSTKIRMSHCLGLGCCLVVAACSRTGAFSGSSAEAGTDSAAERQDGGPPDADGTVDGGDDNRVKLAGAPMIFATTDTGFSINAVTTEGKPSNLAVEIRRATDARWTSAVRGTRKGEDLAEWRIQDLEAGTAYRYRVIDRSPGRARDILHEGTITTRRSPGETFAFCLIADSHIYVDEPASTGGVLAQVAQNIATDPPDFLIHLGDVLDFHAFGFNEPPPDSSWTRSGYLSYRELLGDLLGEITHYSVIGNWDGENGDFTAEQIERSRSQRLLYLPGPPAGTYPQGGSPYQDYFAFEWGDGLFVLLNVMSYTPSGHYLSIDPGIADDWTLGDEQLQWLEETLADSDSRWKFLFIHHAVGGKAGDEINSAYGRGGGLAAEVGEQAIVHGLMRKYGVQAFFYGHDHVFYDMVVDGIHYTLPGSAGAPWKFTGYETGYPEDSYWPDSGHARVIVAPDRVDIDFVDVDNQLIDSFSLDPELP
jgi:predicted phosphodiesterase